jgi:hypothetical protein
VEPAPKPADGRRESWWIPGATALLFLAPLGRAGLWDPHELRVAELARRAAVHLLGAPGLALPDAENRLPTLGDVGQNELPVMSVAVALRLLGLAPWSARLPMALWGIAGVLALWAWLRRAAPGRAGAYGALVLATMPLYFLQARTVLGDVVAMTSQLFAFAGLSVALLEGGPTRGAWAAFGAVGLLCGFFSRGALLGVAVPSVAVALAWLLEPRDEPAQPPPWPERLGALGLLLLGVGAAVLALDALALATPTRFFRALGAAARTGLRYPTFDAVVQQLGHGLFPWAAFLPVALGRLLTPGLPGPARRLRTVLILGVALAYGSHGWIAPRVGVLPFVGVGLLAAMAALVLADLEDGAHPSRALGVATCALGALLAVDLVRVPDRAMTAFGVAQAAAPEGFVGRGWLVGAALAFCLPLGLALLDGDDTPPPSPEKPWPRRYSAWDDFVALLRELAVLWQGNLAFVAVMFEAMLVGLGALLFLGDRLRWRIALVGVLGVEQRWAVMNAWWLLPLALAFGVLGAWTLRLWVGWALAALRIPRAWIAAAGGLAAGLLLSLGYYPTLATQLSPQQAFETYRLLRGGGEPLGLLGVGGRSIAYHTGGEARSLPDAAQAHQWLFEGGRRWLAVRAEELPALNALFRARSLASGSFLTPDHNLPILDGHSGRVLLASNELGGRPNQNPLAQFFSREAPSPRHVVEANLDDTLEALGWDVFEASGAGPVPLVHPGKPYVLHLYWRVLASTSNQWKSFVHVDGFGRRHNGDHDVLGGKVPMRLWQPGDIVTDRHEFQLEPNFTPGDYTLFYGFFLGDRRMPVKRGKHADQRLEGGVFPVR